MLFLVTISEIGAEYPLESSPRSRPSYICCQLSNAGKSQVTSIPSLWKWPCLWVSMQQSRRGCERRARRMRSASAAEYWPCNSVELVGSITSIAEDRMEPSDTATDRTTTRHWQDQTTCAPHDNKAAEWLVFFVYSSWCVTRRIYTYHGLQYRNHRSKYLKLHYVHLRIFPWGMNGSYSLEL